MSFSFADHTGLLDHFLAGRREIVDDIERRLLNVQRKAIRQDVNRGTLSEMLNACFFELPSLPPTASRLKGQLAEMHLAYGFEPMPGDGYSRHLDPVELVLRAHHYWDRDRWPGRNGRLVFAQSLYAAFVLHQLQHLSLRIW